MKIGILVIVIGALVFALLACETASEPEERAGSGQSATGQTPERAASTSQAATGQTPERAASTSQATTGQTPERTTDDSAISLKNFASVPNGEYFWIVMLDIRAFVDGDVPGGSCLCHWFPSRPREG